MKDYHGQFDTRKKSFLTLEAVKVFNTKLVPPRPSDAHRRDVLRATLDIDTQQTAQRNQPTEYIPSVTRRLRMCGCSSKPGGLVSPGPSPPRPSSA